MGARDSLDAACPSLANLSIRKGFLTTPEPEGEGNASDPLPECFRAKYVEDPNLLKKISPSCLEGRKDISPCDAIRYDKGKVDTACRES